MRQVSLTNISFTTPSANNQLFFGGIETLTLQALTFNENQDSKALEGGSLYIKDCFTVSILYNQFIDQVSLIRGGAIFMT